LSIVPASDERIGEYEVVGVLGRGATAVVYRVEDGEGRSFALKRLLAEALADPAARARFSREIEESALLEHPNLLEIHATGEHQGVPFYVMDLVEGTTLEEYLEATELPAPSEAARILRGVARGLAYLHERGLVHRDLKPANIFLAGLERTVRLGDYGLLKSTELDDLTADNERIGTPAYMSPEQFKGLKLDARSDVYQLGVLAYRLLTGQVPFTHNNFFKLGMLHTTKLPTPPSKLAEAVPAELEELVLRCLEKRPRMRYEDAAALEKDLSRFLEPFESGLLPREQVEQRLRAAEASEEPPEPEDVGVDFPAEEAPEPRPEDREPPPVDDLSDSQSTGERMAAVALNLSQGLHAMLPESSEGDPELASRRRELGLALLALGFGGALAFHAASAAPGPGLALALSLWPAARGMSTLFLADWVPGWLRTVVGLAALNAIGMVVPVLAGTPLAELVASEGSPAVSGGLSWLVPLRAPYTSVRGLLLPCLGLALLYASIRSLGRNEVARSMRELCEAAACGAGVLALSRVALEVGAGL
jgi:serine/threonine protein kinase